jgi:signal transduction histidine kinase
VYFFFDDLKHYIDFSAEDASLLKELKPHLEPHFDEIVTHFYDALWANPHTHNIFEGPEQVERLRRSLHRWLAEIFEGPFDNAYFVRRQRIGKAHVNVGLKPHFMFAAMDLVRLDMTRLIEEKALGARFNIAVQKILDIELTLMVQSYFDTLLTLKMQIPAALAAGLAHEIRNPLNTIGLHMTLLERRLRKQGDSGDVVTASIEGVRSEIRRLRGLTSEIIDFAKPLDVSPRWYSTQQLLHSIAAVHGPSLEASNIKLTTSCHGPDEIYADVDRITQALVNLLTNSAEALEGSGHIEISVTNEQGATLLCFEDDGPGLPHDLKFRAFDLFFTTKASGTGMGLPIVQKIVEAHGGSLSAEPSRTQGALFKIRLPRPDRPE